MPDEKKAAEAAGETAVRCRAYSWSDLTLYHMGELTPGEKREMRRHIRECRRCRILWRRARNSVETPLWCTPESAAEAFAREHRGEPAAKHVPQRWRWFEFPALLDPRTVIAALVLLLLGIAGVGIWRYITQERRRIEVLEAAARNPLESDLKRFQLPVSAGAGTPADWVIPSRTLIYGGFVTPAAGLPPLVAPGAEQRGKRGNDRGIPEVVPEPLAPVRTAVRTLRPVFLWSKIPGGTRYEPRLNGGNIFDPANPPELKPGEQYQWTVETKVGGTLRISSPAYFRVLDEKHMAEVAELSRKLAGSPLALAAMYESYGLMDDAIAELGKLPGNSNRAGELIGEIERRKKLP